MFKWLYIHAMGKPPENSSSEVYLRPAASGPATAPGTALGASDNCAAETVSAGVLFERLQRGSACRIVDVRSGPEFEGAHVKDSINQPLDQFNPSAWASISAPEDAPEDGLADAPASARSRTGAFSRAGALYILCQAGGRAGRAGQMLQKAGVPCFVVEGGLDAWMAAGFPVERGTARVLPLMRQVQIVVGLLSGAGAALALWKNPLFAWIPLCMGAGLLFAGLSGTCGLALLLARMPWNRRPRSGGGPVADNSGGSCCGAAPVTKAGGGR